MSVCIYKREGGRKGGVRKEGREKGREGGKVGGREGGGRWAKKEDKWRERKHINYKSSDFLKKQRIVAYV